MSSSATGMNLTGSGSTRTCEVVKGISVAKTFVLLDSAEAPVDVTGWSASFVAKTKKTGGSAILSITGTVGTTNGQITLTKDAATMAALTALETGYFAFTATKANGQVVLLDSGTFKVNAEIPE